MLIVTVAAIFAWPMVLIVIWRGSAKPLQVRRLRHEDAQVTRLRYADPSEQRGQALLFWRVTCRRCLKYGEWPTEREICGAAYGWDIGVAKGADAVGFDQVEGVWFCLECAADVRAYALETLA